MVVTEIGLPIPHLGWWYQEVQRYRHRDGIITKPARNCRPHAENESPLCYDQASKSGSSLTAAFHIPSRGPPRQTSCKGPRTAYHSVSNEDMATDLRHVLDTIHSQIRLGSSHSVSHSDCNPNRVRKPQVQL